MFFGLKFAAALYSQQCTFTPTAFLTHNAAAYTSRTKQVCRYDFMADTKIEF